MPGLPVLVSMADEVVFIGFLPDGMIGNSAGGAIVYGAKLRGYPSWILLLGYLLGDIQYVGDAISGRR